MAVSISWGAQYTKLKTNLRLAASRLKLIEKKKTEMSAKGRPEIVAYITAKKIDSARIRAEHMIREDYLVEAYEMLEMYCDLLLARFGLIEQCRSVDEGICEALSSILWAAPRIACDIPEFKTVSDQLTIKFGKPFAEAARGNRPPSKVSPRLIEKFSVTIPPQEKIDGYLSLICECAGVAYGQEPVLGREGSLIDFGDENAAPTEDNIGWKLGSPATLCPTVPPSAPTLTHPNVNPAPLHRIHFPDTPSAAIQPNWPTLPVSSNTSDTLLPKKPVAPKKPEYDFDELVRRFDQLKKRM